MALAIGAVMPGRAICQASATWAGVAYKSRDFAKAVAAHDLRHKRTRPYTPRTNGKAVRFIQTSLRE